MASSPFSPDFLPDVLRSDSLSFQASGNPFGFTSRILSYPTVSLYPLFLRSIAKCRLHTPYGAETILHASHRASFSRVVCPGLGSLRDYVSIQVFQPVCVQMIATVCLLLLSFKSEG